MNSFRNVQKALEFEVRRQRDMLLEGEVVVQQTLLWDPDRQVTSANRSKEEAQDYRYFPDPDLVPVVIDDAWIDRVRHDLPELPEAKLARFMDELGLGEEEATILTSERPLADYFETALAVYANGNKLGNWILTEVMRELKGAEGMDIATFPVKPVDLAKLMAMIDKGTISGKIAKTVFEEMIQSGQDAETIVKEKNLVQNSDEGEILHIVQEILANNPEQVADFKGGKTKLMGFFVGQLMKASKGKANPQMANTLFSQELTK
jgi:aspartyl-tRNA(Asn)/glutamyl-tRNA(Gln) amidotransferase subunit B